MRTDTFELGRLGLVSGQGRRLDLHVAVDSIPLGHQSYSVEPSLIGVRLDISRTTANGWALRLRFASELHGVCWRCLAEARPAYEVDAREVHQPSGGEELRSPYVDAEDDLDLKRWAFDALVLALPAQITCRPDCLGLCAQCGVDLNEDPEHAHEPAPDPRWAKLREEKAER